MVIILTFLDKWTDFLGPLIYLNDQSTVYTVVRPATIPIDTYGVAWGPLMVASVLFMAPVILLFMVAQKSFISGITLGGIKG